MTSDDFKKYPDFSISDNWGNISLVNEDLVIKLQQIRHCANSPLIIHCATQGLHSPNSLHYKGLACDFHIKGLSLLDQYLIAEKIIGCGGIGLYPQWRPEAGLHIDLRYSYIGARWIFYEGHYKELTAKNFYLVL